jgi:hypothetical protein
VQTVVEAVCVTPGVAPVCARRLQARPWHLVRQLMRLLMGDCLARTSILFRIVLDPLLILSFRHAEVLKMRGGLRQKEVDFDKRDTGPSVSSHYAFREIGCAALTSGRSHRNEISYLEASSSGEL